MNARRLDGIVRGALDPLLVAEHGFTFDRGGYYRDLPSGVRHLFDIDLGRHGRDTFRVLIGANCLLLRGESATDEEIGRGHLVHRFFNGGGIGQNQRSWPCHTAELARRSAEQIAGFFPAVALPWFSQLQTPADLVDHVLEPRLRAPLLEVLGRTSEAHAIYLDEHQRLQRQLLSVHTQAEPVAVEVIQNQLLPALAAAVARTAPK